MTIPGENDHDDDGAQDAVSVTAYFLWENAGRPDRRSEEFWHRACEIHARKPPTDARQSSSSGDGGAPVDGDTPPGELASEEALSLAIETERQRDA